MPVEPRKPRERTEPITLKEPISVQNWVREHPLYKSAATERDTLARRVAELETLLAAADGLHRVAMGAAEKHLGVAEASRDELASHLRVVRETNTQLQTEVRDLRNRLGAELGESDLCA